MSINAGTFNRRVRIEYKVATPDAHFGTEIITWTTLATVYCELVDVLPSRSEAVKNGLVMAANQTRMRCRYRTDINSSMRIVWMLPVQTIYQIIAGPAMIGNKEGLELMLEKYST